MPPVKTDSFVFADIPADDILLIEIQTCFFSNRGSDMWRAFSTSLAHRTLITLFNPQEKINNVFSSLNAVSWMEGPGVNFTNNLQAAFAPISFQQKDTNPDCKNRKAAKNTFVQKKPACKMLAKLTLGLNFNKNFAQSAHALTRCLAQIDAI